MQARVKPALLIAAIAVPCLAVLAFIERGVLLDLLGSVLQYGIGIQRDFTRNIGHRMRDVRDGGDPASLWIALGFAFTYGVAHALGPGHGKFVVTTYFLAHERRPWRGFLMGIQIAVMHVISAIAIVLIAHYLATRFWGPTGDMPVLRSVSYGSIALVGLYMLWKALRSTPHEHHDHDHGSCGHNHGDSGKQGLLSFTVGVAPCSGAVLLLIFAFANDLVPLGLLMTAAIAGGMAVTMIGLGLAAIFARRMVIRRLAKSGKTGSGRVGRIVELTGAGLITLFGLAMTVVSVAI
jgi:ABC-type nickel/cobalt efflux system permease component RcnA